MTKTVVQINCLGDFAVQGLPIRLRGRKQIALLAYLASNLGSDCSRATLASVFWGDRFDEQARQSLRQSLSVLRKAFADHMEALRIERDWVRLNADHVRVDVQDAAAALASGDLERAAGIFRGGGFLDTVTAKETGLSDWLAVERAKWRDLARQAIVGRATDLYNKGQPVAAEEMAAWQLQQDPYDEAAVRIAMQAKAASGSLAGAARLYRRHEVALRDELGIVPAPETVACFRQLQDGNSSNDRELAVRTLSEDRRPRVMVLPFTDAHAGPDGSTMADSLTDEVIAALGRFSELAVIGRNTAIGYREGPRDLPGMVQDLKIQYVVSGTVRRLGERLRIGVELDDAVAQRFVSSERRDCDIADFYDVQDDLARAIAGAVEPALIAAAARDMARRPVGSLDLWEKSLVARSQLDNAAKNSLFTAEALALDILKDDPNQLPALKVLAITRFALVWNLSVADLTKTSEQALATAERVLELDPFDAESLSVAARCYLTLRYYDKALELAETSVARNPSNAQSHIHLGACYTNVGRFDEAFAHFSEARRISPRDRLMAYWDCAESYAHYGRGSYDDVIRVAGSSAKKPNTWAWTRIVLAIALVKRKRQEAAAAEIGRLLSDYPGLTCSRLRPLLMPQFERDMVASLTKAGLPR